MTTNHLKMEVELTHETWCILTKVQILGNVQHNTRMISTAQIIIKYTF
jgi:hypothetical protein